MIYLLERIDVIDLDEFAGKIIRARSEKEAREIANHSHGDEGKVWTNPQRVACELLDPDGPSKELLGDFRPR